MTTQPSLQPPYPEPSGVDDELGHATWLLDISVTTLLFLFTVAPTVLVGLRGALPASGILVDMALVGTMLLRRRRPMTALALTVVLCLAHLWCYDLPTPALLCVLLVSYSVARWVPGRRSRVVLLAGLVGSLLGPAWWLWGHPVFYFPWTVFVLAAASCFGLVTACYAIGRRVREAALAERERALSEARRHSMELAEREQQARITDASTRATIARELHDIVAHSLSVMIVQAEGGRALARKRPEQAEQVLDTIAETGREALTEMRRIVGVLRDGSDEAGYAPAPGLADIPELVARSGGQAELVVDGEAPPVSSTLALTAYRVVQEALTNVLKHAGPEAHALVRISFTPLLIVLEVTDDGLGEVALASSDGRGHGLQGMRERVAAMHGQLVAQALPGGGFTVRAVLPVPARGNEHQPTQEMR